MKKKKSRSFAVFFFRRNKCKTINGERAKRNRALKSLHTVTLEPAANRSDNKPTLNLGSQLLFVLEEHIGTDRVYSTFQIKEGTAGIKVQAREWKQRFGAECWQRASAAELRFRGSV